jgi:seryl-tRNA synthetase
LSGERHRIELARVIDADLAADIVKQSAYVSPSLRALAVEEGGRAVSFAVTGGDAAGEVGAKVERFVRDMTDKHRKLPRTVVGAHRPRRERALASGVYEELKRRRWAIELGRGQVGLAGPALACARAIDDECARIGRDAFGAADESYPALIPSAVLGRCGYFASFPQAVSMVSHLAEDYDLIDEFRRANVEAPSLTVPNAAALPTPEACLVPAVCYHAYQSLEGKALDDRGVVVTASGKCFRYESTNFTGLDRLWDFTMREVVFVGTESFIVERRKRAIDAVLAQLEAWDLDGSVETANDPFFPATYATKTYWQVRADLKFELRLAVEPSPSGDARTLACGSLNLHESFFGTTFGITASDGKPAFTGCVGWGLERWVLACFTQHGFDASAWPKQIRAKVFG